MQIMNANEDFMLFVEVPCINDNILVTKHV